MVLWEPDKLARPTGPRPERNSGTSKQHASGHTQGLATFTELVLGKSQIVMNPHSLVLHMGTPQLGELSFVSRQMQSLLSV